jgi:hypothetical protein
VSELLWFATLFWLHRSPQLPCNSANLCYCNLSLTGICVVLEQVLVMDTLN